MAKITQYTELTTVAGSDVLIIVDDVEGTPTTKKVSASNLLAVSHPHAASDITSGLLVHERGGLEADVSAITTGGLLVGTGPGVIGILGVGSVGQVPTAQANGSVTWSDAVGNALDAIEFKASVRLATTENITLSGEQTIDGLTTSSDDVLVKDQGDATENGIYTSGEYGWTRREDMAAGSDASASFCFVQEGATNADTGWLCTSNSGSAVVGTNNLAFSQFSGGATGSSFLAEDGSAASPSYSFASEPDTGVYLLGGGIIAVSIDGSVAGRFTSSSLLWGTNNTGTVYLEEGAFQSRVAAGQVVFADEYDNGDSGTAKGIVWDRGNGQKVTLTGNCMFTFSLGGVASYSGAHLTLKTIQDATGGRTITWPTGLSGVKWAGGTAPTPTSTPGAVDIYHFYTDGGAYYGHALLNVS